MKCKQIKKDWGGRFFKNLPPQVFYLFKKRKKCLKKDEIFGAIFLASIFAKKHTQKTWILLGHLIIII